MLRIFLILAFVPGVALADLGDTTETARLKYGPASPTQTPQILAYLHGNKYRVWQTYDDKGVCVIAEFSPLNHEPLTPVDCQKLDAANLPGLTPGVGAGWNRVTWPGTISFEYTGPEQQLFQVMESQDKDGWSRMYLNGAGIAFIKSLPQVGR
jgi:hypothetical protein